MRKCEYSDENGYEVLYYNNDIASCVLKKERERFEKVLELCNDENKIDIYDSSQYPSDKKIEIIHNGGNDEASVFDFYRLDDGIIVAVRDPESSNCLGKADCYIFKGDLNFKDGLLGFNGVMIEKRNIYDEQYIYSIYDNNCYVELGNVSKDTVLGAGISVCFVAQENEILRDYAYTDSDIFGYLYVYGEKLDGNDREFWENGEDMITMINNMVSSSTFKNYAIR